jgi:di/tricarboxylate transporter
MKSSRRTIDNWLAVGLFLLFSAVVALFIAYVSQPPNALKHISGKVVGVNDAQPSKHPKLNLFVNDSTGRNSPL